MSNLSLIFDGFNADQLRTLFEDGVVEAAKGGAAEIIKRVLRHRRRMAFDLLLGELRRGTTTADRLGLENDVVSVLLRYQRAADEGAARLNLRLMAQVIAGSAFTGTLRADEFLTYADMLAALRREEVVLMATMHRIQRRHGAGGTPVNILWGHLMDEVVPSLFKDERDLRATAMACLRTGLIMDMNTIDDMGLYTTSPLFQRLTEIASFEAALRDEPESSNGPRE